MERGSCVGHTQYERVHNYIRSRADRDDNVVEMTIKDLYLMAFLMWEGKCWMCSASECRMRK